MSNPFLQRLNHAAHLTNSDELVMENLCRRPRYVGTKKFISRDGDKIVNFPVLLSGWSARYQVLRNGSRQITRLLLPGDAFYFDSSPEAVAIERVVTLCPCKIIDIPHAQMRGVIDRVPAISEAMRNYGGMENAILVSWIVNCGRRDALERLAHLICELHYRLSLIGLVENGQFFFPPTQYDLADVLALTPVHINRKLQQLRQEKLISLESKQMRILDSHRLQQVANFDSAYLSPRAGNMTCDDNGPLYSGPVL